MQIVLTGSLGHISKPLAIQLIRKGHSVTLISSDPAKQKEIAATGAIPAIGSLYDENFLLETFTGAEAVYTMLPPFPFEKNPNLDARAEAKRLATIYAGAIRRAKIKKVVHLSSIGAHTAEGNGLLAFHFFSEQKMNELSEDIAITYLRPVGFYYNLYQFTDIIKGEGWLKGFVGLIMTLKYYGLAGLLKGKRGLIMSNYGGEDKMPWVSPDDIAEAAAEELIAPAKGRKVRYVASEIMTCNQVAATLGAAIGKPYLKWGTVTDRQMKEAMLKLSMPEKLVDDIIEMNAGMRNGGSLFDDYYEHEPTLGKVKMKDFAREFAGVYYSKQ